MRTPAPARRATALVALSFGGSKNTEATQYQTGVIIRLYALSTFGWLPCNAEQAKALGSMSVMQRLKLSAQIIIEQYDTAGPRREASSLDKPSTLTPKASSVS
jgi:hypothetical protein